MTDRMKTNVAWLLTGAVLVLVAANIYTNLNQRNLVVSHSHPITDHNNNKESESSCPCILTPSLY